MSQGESKEKRIVSKQTDAVWIGTGRMLWSKLTPSIRKILLDGLERIATTYAELRHSTRVSSLPPIQIKCELWVTDDRSKHIDGRAGPVRYKGGFWPGAELSARICACEDLALLRALLVHEFLHIFYISQRVVHADALPGSRIDMGSFDPFSAAEDDAALAKPEDWFSDPQDWELLRHGHDARMKPFDTGQVLLAKHLRQPTPSPSFEANMSFPVEWLEHAQKLCIR